VRVVSIAIVLFVANNTHGQLRVVQYNTAGGPRPGAATVLEQIGLESVNGLSRPIDVLVIEEQTSTTLNSYVSILNNIYGPQTYAAAPLVGLTSGGGRPAMIYRQSSVNLIDEPIGIGTVNTSANARQTIRYQLRPVGYGSNADLFLYASHYKASSGGTNAARRNIEALANRADADLLGLGANVLYVGDFNFYSGTSTEPAYATLTALPGAGMAIDPTGAPALWSGTANRIYHTQSPVTAAQYAGQVTGGLNDRFDFQLGNLQLHDGYGLNLISNSYRVFGNNGTHPLDGSVNSPSNTWDNSGLTISHTVVLNALTTVTDHLPVVADYDIIAIPGDADLNGIVDISDLTALVSSWQMAGGWVNGDFDHTGFVDVQDLSLLAAHWQQTTTLASQLSSLGIPQTAVPEPSCAALGGLLLMILVRKRVKGFGAQVNLIRAREATVCLMRTN
jgi:hypothetical protein